MGMVKINDEGLEKLKDFRDRLKKSTGIKLSLGNTIKFILKYGPKPEEYYFIPASKLKEKKRGN